jgi:hypothetical protein
MGFKSEDGGKFNEVKSRGNDGIHLKVNSLRDALSSRFRPSMHSLDTIRPTAFSENEEGGVIVGLNDNNIFANTMSSFSSTTSAWEDLAALASGDAASVHSHTASDGV